MRTRALVFAAVAAVVLVACGGTIKPTDTVGGADKQALYDRLGGKDAITAVVDDFVANIVADKAINTFFTNADISRLKQMLADQICAATGGPCKYTGKDMKTSHAGMNIKPAEFDALVADLKKSLDKFKVGPGEQGELLGVFGRMKGDIVTAP